MGGGEGGAERKMGREIKVQRMADWEIEGLWDKIGGENAA